MNNYPPGVSGNEDAFGPQHEVSYSALGIKCRYCDKLSDTQVTRLTWNYSIEDVFECPECGEENSIDVELPEQDWDKSEITDVQDFYGGDY